MSAELAYCVTLSNTTTASDCQTACGQISWDETEQGIDDCDGKEFEFKYKYSVQVACY